MTTCLLLNLAITCHINKNLDEAQKDHILFYNQACEQRFVELSRKYLKIEKYINIYDGSYSTRVIIQNA